MEPLLLGLAAPSIGSAAKAVGRTASAAAKPFAAILQAAGRALQGDTDSPDAPINGADRASAEQLPAPKIADIRSNADTLQKKLEQQIQEALDNSGISLDKPVRLRVSDFDGTIEVMGVHPQRTIIEAALAEDPAISTDFRQLAAMRKLLSAADESQDFAAAFARDPWSTIAENASQLDGRHEAMLQLSADSSEMRLKFVD